jgi:hypothetical protein
MVLLSTTNKMQRYTIFFITVDSLHVSGGFSDHHQELKNCTQHLVRARLAAANAGGRSRKPGTYKMLCVQFLSS